MSMAWLCREGKCSLSWWKASRLRLLHHLKEGPALGEAENEAVARYIIFSMWHGEEAGKEGRR